MSHRRINAKEGARDKRVLDPREVEMRHARDEDPLCPLCDRPIPPDVRQSLHHLIPRLRGGHSGPTVLLHQICHNEIHAAFSETDLARHYNTIGALRAHPRIARFIAWVGDRPPDFHSRTAGRGRRRR